MCIAQAHALTKPSKISLTTLIQIKKKIGMAKVLALIRWFLIPKGLFKNDVFEILSKIDPPSPSSSVFLLCSI